MIDEPTKALNVSAHRKALILKAVADKHGILTPDLVVSESDPSNPNGIAHDLAPHVAWNHDDATCAHSYRVDQARRVIRSCEPELIQLGVIQIKAPYYVRDPRKSPSEQGYTPLLSIKTHKEVAEDTVRAEIGRAVSSLERAYSVAMALEMEEEASDVYAALSALGRAPVANLSESDQTGMGVSAQGGE